MATPFRVITVSLAAATSAAVILAAQQPRIANARITTQPADSAFGQSVRALVANQPDAAWIGYAVPVVDSERIMCCFGGDTTWVSGGVVTSDGRQRACRLEPAADGTSMARRAPSGAGGAVVRLESSDRMIVLIRAMAREVDRIRVFSEDCELDADGRQVTWLENVRPADSIALLETYAAPATGRRDRVTEGALSAIALHADASADASLERLVAVTQPEALRRKVTFWLGNARGARGLDVLRRILKDDPSAEVQKSAVFGVAQSPDRTASDTLIGLARGHEAPRVRSEAIFWLGQKAGQKASATIREAVDQDPETEVKKKAVFALSQLPKDEGVPLLIQIARTHKNTEVRKQAMFWLGQSRDSRAIDFFAEILK